MTNARTIRKTQGKTLLTVAREAGISIQFLADFEQGRRSAKRETEQRIADALGVTVEELHESKGEETDDDGRETEDSPRNRAV